METPLFIVNPVCGNRKAGFEIEPLLARLNRAYGTATICRTKRPGHAEELALEGVANGHPLIVAVGGDGTLNEVVNGVLRAGGDGETGEGGQPGAADAAVGLISIGTGGDFRRSLGIGPGIEASLEALRSGRERLIDVLLTEFCRRDGKPVKRYVVNVASAGLGGLVDRYMESTPSFVPGRLGYYVAALRAAVASRQEPFLARIRWQGETREETIPAYLIAVCNGRWFGGGMDVAPMARPDDGRLEVVTVASPTKPYLLRHIKDVYEGRHLDLPSVNHFSCDRVELRLEDAAAERRILLDVDGDALGSLPLSVEVLPKRLRIHG
jgi:diacylglycerol kinase (ATP)